MISMTTLSVQQLPAWRTPLRDPRAPAQEPSPGFGLPSLTEMRDSARSMKKEMAAKRVQAVRERMDALKLMVKIDPRAGLKMTAELAKELKSAVKDYVDAGGRNVTDGEMAMMRRDANDAREAADAALKGLPTDPGEADVEVVEAEVDIEAETATVDAGMKRAQAAYAAAFGIADGRDATADRAEAVLGAAMTDRGFFEQVKRAVAELKEARDKIKADRAHPKSPDKDDWKAADREMAELEKAIDMAPTGAPDPAASGASVKA